MTKLPMHRPVVLFVAALATVVGCAPRDNAESGSTSTVADETTIGSDLVSDSSTTSVASTGSTTELNIAGGNDPEDGLMPDVLCMTLQEAQDEIQDHGVFFSRSVDATGQDRMQLLDSNWIVIGQAPSAGTAIGEGDAILSVVKIGESTNGIC